MRARFTAVQRPFKSMALYGPPMRIKARGHGRGPDEPPEDCGCGVCGVVDLLGRKWTLDLVGVLHEQGPVRFNAIQRELDGISPRTLSDRLDQLEDQGLVERFDHDETPPKVEYELADDGHALVQALEPLVAWADRRNS